MSANASIGYCSRCNSWILWRCVDTQSDLERGEWPLILNENFEFAKADGDTKRAFNGTPIKMRLDARTELYKWTDEPLIRDRGISPWWCFVEDTRLPNGKVAEG